MKTLISTIMLLFLAFNAAFSQCNPQFTTSVNGNAVTFTNNSTPTQYNGYYTNLTIDYGDGTSWSNFFIPYQHQYQYAGNYTITLTQTIIDSTNNNNLICTSSTSSNVTIANSINCSTSPTISYSSTSITNQVSFNVIPNVTVIPSSSSYYLSIMYDYGDGTSGISPYHTYTASGNYTVTATVSILEPNLFSIVYCSSTASTTVNFIYTNPCNSTPTFTLSNINSNNVSITGINQANYQYPYQYSYVIDYGDGTNYTTQYIGNYYSHFYPNAGNYNVCITETITDSLTNTVVCTNSFCNTANITNTVPVYTGCDANFAVQPDTINNSLTYFFSGDASTTSSGTITNYAWDFGDGTTGTGLNVNHTYLSAGIYNVCLTITTSSSCTDATCFNVNIEAINPLTLGHIEGTVFDNNMVPLTQSIVYLIKYNQTTQTLELAQSHLSNTGSYRFNVNAGTYLVKASPLPTSNNALYTLIPTYSTNQLLWNTASNAVVANSSYVIANIYLQTGTNIGGPGFISGSVITGANKTLGVGDPKEGLTVLLINATTNNVSAYTTTDANGEYEFSNIAVGDYKIYIEELGKTMTPKLLSITTSNASFIETDFVSSSTENHPLAPAGITDNNTLQNTISVYPNPCEDLLNIHFDNSSNNSTVSISIKSIEGKEVQKIDSAVGNDIQVNSKHLMSGIYYLTIQQNNQTVVKQFSKY